MNKLKGIISQVVSDEHMSIVEMKVNEVTLKTIVIETPDTASFLQAGNEINILFKETEVSIATDYSGKISLQNKMNCQIRAINKGRLLSTISLDFKGTDISSVITSAAVEQLNLKVNDEVTALVKTNEIIISPE